MRRSLRLALLAVGLAAIVYGVASLTGEWLGTPPWWTERTVSTVNVFEREYTVTLEQLSDGREWISTGVVALGLGLIAFGAWPRQSRPMATS